jgi:hypothetical protein
VAVLRLYFGQTGTTANRNAFLSQAAGGGVAGSFSTTETVGFTGASGTGAGGQIADAPSATVSQAAGVGVAGSIGRGDAGSLVGASGTGLVGQLTPTFAVPSAVGIGLAGSILAGLSGGGTSKRPIEEDAPKRRDPRIRTGLLPLQKRSTPPKAEPEPDLLPPYRSPTPPLAPAVEPPRLEAPSSALSIFEQIKRDVLDARDQSDIERLLNAHDEDERDIAEIEAMLELLD